MRRREMIKRMVKVTAGINLPTIIPARVLGQTAPSNTIQVGQIGCGRIAWQMDMPGIRRVKGVKIVGLADFDTNRLSQAKAELEKFYREDNHSVAIKTTQDYQELLCDKGIDAVSISTPDHWHSQPAVEAAFAGKDIYMQKPTSLTISEGRLVSDATRMNGRVFLLGSQQRSTKQFHRACELVRNGRLGKIKTIEIGLPGDPIGGSTKEMPIPGNLNYNAWLGATPLQFYTEDRVHSQKQLTSRPGWLRCEQFGAGMITGWGTHHLDIAHWAMGWEDTGPVTIEDHGTTFNHGALWDVHAAFDVQLTYADGTIMHVCDKFPNGIRFIGENGWIFVSRGAARITDSDPLTPGKELQALDASNPKLLEGDAGKIKLYQHLGNHHQNWIDCIRSRKESLVPVETAHRSCSACLLAHIGMKLKRKLNWNPSMERFVNDDEANSMLERQERAPYGTRHAYERLTQRS